MKDMPEKNTPASVPARATQARIPPPGWEWTESTVWTTRMLTTLRNGGPKGGRWFSLIDKVYFPANLCAAWSKVLRNKGAAGIDGQSIASFEHNAEVYLKEISDALREERYEPSPVRRQWIPKPGTNKKRPLGIPVVKDRIVQGALRHVLEPLWEARFAEHSYGFRPGRSCHDALRRVAHLLEDGYEVVVDADIQSYFDEIDKDLLMKAVSEVVSDGRVLRLVRLFLEQSVVEEMKEWVPTKGTPQGAVISPLLANIYLHSVDLAIRDSGFELVRYADDLVILCKSREDAERALALLHTLMTGLKLKLHPEKTKIVDTREVGAGFDFLGYRFERSHSRLNRKLRKKSRDALKAKIRELTPRKAGRSIKMIVADLNPVLRGWFNYFRDCAQFVFEDTDKFIRRRLRSILRKNLGMKGTGHGCRGDHQRWPIAYFSEVLGLFSVTAAWKALRQPR